MRKVRRFVSQPSDKSNAKGNALNPFDPLGFWRTTQDSALDSWSKSMVELVNSEPYAEATARMLDSYLSMSIPMRKLLSQTMEQTLSQFNMPTRTEVVSLAERMTNIEMRLDDMDARMDDILRLLKSVASAQASAPAEPPAARAAARPTRAIATRATTGAAPGGTTGRTRRTRSTDAGAKAR
ncbi:MAG TPA: poly(R)-hydroxyalkanoic acid synthase subunit PhaE [Ktedonobacterales bacterium]